MEDAITNEKKRDSIMAFFREYLLSSMIAFIPSVMDEDELGLRSRILVLCPLTCVVDMVGVIWR